MKMPDSVGQWLVLAGGVIHGAGAKMIQARNDELAAELAAVIERGRPAIRHAYALGRIHGQADAPWFTPDELAERVAHMIETIPLDVDEHQGAAAAEPNIVRPVDAVPETRLSRVGAAAADHSAPLVDVDAIAREVDRRAAVATASAIARDVADVDEHQGDELDEDGTL